MHQVLAVLLSTVDTANQFNQEFPFCSGRGGPIIFFRWR